jgi:hypothetical protein
MAVLLTVCHLTSVLSTLCALYGATLVLTVCCCCYQRLLGISAFPGGEDMSYYGDEYLQESLIITRGNVLAIS